MRKYSFIFILIVIISLCVNLYVPLKIVYAETTTTAAATEETGTKCILPESVTKDLSGALKIFKIVAPLLVIGLTVYESILAISAGDVSAKIKPFFIKLLKRVAAAVILFILPVLIDVLMQLLDFWDANGKCRIGTNISEVSK